MRVSELKRGAYFWFMAHAWGNKVLLARCGGRSGRGFTYITYVALDGDIIPGALIPDNCICTPATDGELLAARLQGSPLLKK